MKKVARPVLVVLLLLVAAEAAAVTTKSWRTSSFKELDEGEAEQALITSEGVVMPGRETKQVPLETEAIWCAARGKDGTFYAGGVTDGSIWAVSGGKARKLATLVKETPWIGALVVDDKGRLFAGTLASGSVYEVDTKSGQTRKVAELEGAQHVWALVPSSDGKSLWAATGPKGGLYEVDIAGKKATRVWQAEEDHLLSMTRAKDGALWLGSADEAILYRFDPKTKTARAMADFDGSEIRGVVAVDGALVVAANDFDEKKIPGLPESTAKKPDEGVKATAPGAGEPGATTKDFEPPRKGSRKGKGALFRVEPDGRIEQLFSLKEGYFQALAVSPAGEVLAASGNQGRVYQILRDRSVVTLYDVEERQVNAVVVAGGQLAFATGDSAAFYVDEGPAKKARYASDVHDAGAPAQWGHIEVRGKGDLAVETRSGYTAEPGDGWSPWRKVAKLTADGPTARKGEVTSPAGRYVQYRVSFENAEAALQSATLFYVPVNQRARVTGITVSGKDFTAGASTEKGPTTPRSPIIKLAWKVEEPDTDRVSYLVEYKLEGETEWRRLPTGKERYEKETLDWNTESLPDGWYRVRVTGTDELSNPGDLALSHTEMTEPFLIDNTKPAVDGLAVKDGGVAGRAVDSFSRVVEMAWTVDDGDWSLTFPSDGIHDEKVEPFSFSLPKGLAAGVHTVTVRVVDEAGNIGSKSLTFRVK